MVDARIQRVSIVFYCLGAYWRTGPKVAGHLTEGRSASSRSNKQNYSRTSRSNKMTFYDSTGSTHFQSHPLCTCNRDTLQTPLSPLDNLPTRKCSVRAHGLGEGIQISSGLVPDFRNHRFVVRSNFSDVVGSVHAHYVGGISSVSSRFTVIWSVCGFAPSRAICASSVRKNYNAMKTIR